MLSLVEIGPAILEKKIFKCFLSIFAILLLFPLEEAFQLNKHKSLSIKDNLCQIWLKLTLWFWKRWKCEKFTDTRTGSGEEDSFQIIFTIYQLSSLLVLRLNKPRMSFTQRYPKIHVLCAKFGWNWPNGSGEGDEKDKSLQTGGHTDGRQTIRKARELLA